MIEQLADMVLRFISESTSRIVYKPLPADDPLQRQPDSVFAREKLGGWEPKINLEEGLQITIDYFNHKLSIF